MEDLFNRFAQTNADYNQYLGVQHIRPLSSVYIHKKLPVKKYTIMIACAVLCLGIIGFAVASRMYDIFLAALREKEEENTDAENKSVGHRAERNEI